MTERARKFSEKLIEAACIGRVNVGSVLWSRNGVRYDVLALFRDKGRLYIRGDQGGAYKPWSLAYIAKTQGFMTEGEKNRKKKKGKLTNNQLKSITSAA